MRVISTIQQLSVLAIVGLIALSVYQKGLPATATDIGQAGRNLIDVFHGNGTCTAPKVANLS